MDVEIIVPIGIFLLILGIIWILSKAGEKKRQAAHETLRLMIEKGQEVSPKLINDMSMITSPRRNDLRRGVILIALAIAFIVIGIIATLHGDNDGEVFMISVFPGLIGLAFLGLWKFGYDGDAN